MIDRLQWGIIIFSWETTIPLRKVNPFLSTQNFLKENPGITGDISVMVTPSIYL